MIKKGRKKEKLKIHAERSKMVRACHHLWELLSTSSMWALGICTQIFGLATSAFYHLRHPTGTHALTLMGVDSPEKLGSGS